jgi:hypothetical protein
MRRLAFVLLAVACNRSFTPAEHVEGLRVLAIKAEPPEVAPGGMTTLTALAVDTTGAQITVDWAACTEPAQPGNGIVNPDCLQNDTASFLVPLGSGASILGTLPTIDPNTFAPPDASGGIYLPVRARTSTSGDRVDTIYQMRLALGQPPNHNPTFAGIFVVAADGSTTPLDEATPPDVSTGQTVKLRATFTPDSAETYMGQRGPLTEELRVAWFATGGTFSEPVTGPVKPDTVFSVVDPLPGPGATIDLWVVGRDERGGTDFVHRAFTFR